MSCNRYLFRSALLAVSLLSGCGGISAYHPPKERDYRVTYRRFAPDSVYNRLKWVQLPAPVPSEKTAQGDLPYIFPIIEFSVKNESLEEAIGVLAASAGYQAYTESSIAGKKLSLEMLGTMDEVALRIAERADVKIVVDHDGKVIRVFGVGAETPRFTDEVIDEHQSGN